MIDILVPVLGRPQNAAPLVQNIRAVTTVPATVTFLCSPDDADQIKACHDLYDIGAKTVVMDWQPGQGDFARKINYGFGWTIPLGHDWTFMAADDVVFEPNWDTIALRAAGRKHGVVATNDLANAQVRRGQFGTHCLIRRSYITEQGGTADNEPGVVLHEGYDHNFVDRELCHVAQARKQFVFARHSRVRHQHPLWRTAPQDSTYKKALGHFRDDQKLFLSRAHLWNHVGLSAPERKIAA